MNCSYVSRLLQTGEENVFSREKPEMEQKHWRATWAFSNEGASVLWAESQGNGWGTFNVIIFFIFFKKRTQTNRFSFSLCKSTVVSFRSGCVIRQKILSWYIICIEIFQFYHKIFMRQQSHAKKKKKICVFNIWKNETIGVRILYYPVWCIFDRRTGVSVVIVLMRHTVIS